jgi:polyhydroxybutyrate depolymerase
MKVVKKVFVTLSAILVWTAIPAASANAVSIGQACAKTTLGTRVSIRVNKKPVIVVCRTVAGRKKWIRAAVQTLVTTTTSTSTTSTTVPEPVVNYTDVVDPIDPTLHTITIEGMKPRTYYLNIPPNYSPANKIPVLLAFHGLGGSSSSFNLVSRLGLFYQSMNFILVLPNGWGSEAGSQNSWNAGACCAPAATYGIDDVGFVRAILHSVSKNYSTDSSRIWAMGFSNGGMMSYRLACELSEKFTAIGVGAGSLMVNTCSPPNPVSIIHIHGNLDTSIPIDGGGVFRVPPVIDAFKKVNSSNPCSNMVFEVVSTSSSETTSAVCADGTEGKLTNYFNQDHTWTIDWTKEVITFLFAHPRK